MNTTRSMMVGHEVVEEPILAEGGNSGAGNSLREKKRKQKKGFGGCRGGILAFLRSKFEEKEAFRYDHL